MECLDYYADEGLSAVFYDLVQHVDPTNKGDLDFYAALPPPGGRVLELGCGTGRIALGLAQRGFRVVGTDIAPSMLERAKIKGGAARFLAGDMTSLRLAERFDAVLIPGFSLAHLAPAHWADAFDTVAAHLEPGGVAAVHLPDPVLMALPATAGKVLDVTFGDTGRLTIHLVSQSFHDARFEQVLDYDAAGPVERRSRERFIYHDADPTPFAEAAGLRLERSSPLGAGRVFLFRA